MTTQTTVPEWKESSHQPIHHHSYQEEYPPLPPQAILAFLVAGIALLVFLFAGVWHLLGFDAAFLWFLGCCLVACLLFLLRKGHVHIQDMAERKHLMLLSRDALKQEHSIEYIPATRQLRTISPFTVPNGPITIKDVTLGNTEQEQQEQQALPVASPLLDDFYDAIPYNSLQTGLGAKLSDGELVMASIEESVHYKLIGGSGFGKSCLAAGMLDIATTTNSPDILRLALLDLSWKTGKLFEHLPHVYEIQQNGRLVRMIGRDADEVASRLRSLKKELERRAAGLLKTPILLIFIEEMLSLQYEVDPRLLAQMLADLNVLVLRGRQYGMFFLSVMQTDYATKELREAKAQFRTRAGFAIDTNAARSAGFVNTELVKQNFMRGRPGQYLLERPAFSELMLAPRYNVEQKLLTPPPTTNPTTNLRQTYDPGVVEEQATTPPVEPLVVETPPALSVRDMRVLELLKQRIGQNEIIQECWGVKYNQGRAYQNAVAEYREIVARLVGEA